MRDEEFYIGYLPKMPLGVARVVRPFVITLLILAGTFAIILVVGQQPFAKSYFEFGQVKDFEGTIIARPIPFLLIERPERINGLPAFEHVPLVAEGKHEAGAMVANFDSQKVRLKGTKIYRDQLQMIEVVADSVEISNEPVQRSVDPEESLGTQTLIGEIVDSKCYLGVMNPGNRKTHRSCAVSCLRGGIPALFVVKDDRGNVSELWLLSNSGESINKQILDYVAEPVEMTGEVKRTGDQLFFYSNPSSIKRLL